jgi:hypothetical protein
MADRIHSSQNKKKQSLTGFAFRALNREYGADEGNLHSAHAESLAFWHKG